MSFIASIIIGGLAGWLAGLIRRGHGFGILTNIIVGIVGGFLGGLLFGALGIQGDGFIGNLIISTLGAVILLAILNFFGVNKS
jgi:uncharacterized membrane protein YeaQ/YmgE (transglycosylase-associated protein family)